MQCSIADLRYKEVINVNTGVRLGYVIDALFETHTGRIIALVCPTPSRFLGMFGRGDDYVIPWECIKRIGEDIILVDAPEDFRQPNRKGR
ncbi:MAG: YlmC/YmxH family sporulation protein [Oscillospiraceae bacterium]|jgi:YlmC/YmxH family sporulation protein|nr:YlmC/YmxH family sporulation protein [Oscillospiraceae bacterium]